MRCPAVLLVLSFTACRAPLSASFQGTSPQPASQTLKCAAKAADSLGYKPTFTQHGKTLEAIHKDSALVPGEDSRNQRLTAVGSDSKKEPGSSTFTITAATFSLRWTSIGLESQEVPASEKVKADGKTIAARCGGTPA